MARKRGGQSEHRGIDVKGVERLFGRKRQKWTFDELMDAIEGIGATEEGYRKTMQLFGVEGEAKLAEAKLAIKLTSLRKTYRAKNISRAVFLTLARSRGIKEVLKQFLATIRGPENKHVRAMVNLDFVVNSLREAGEPITISNVRRELGRKVGKKDIEASISRLQRLSNLFAAEFIRN